MEAPAHALTWGLLVATKDRLEELKTCIACACAQSRLPAEIIVADASADWEVNAAVIEKIVRQRPDIRFAYLPADKPSLTVQRNQTIARAATDIVFMIDDDSFMYPDCAEEIMKVYEADTEKRVAGVQAVLASSMPAGTTVATPQKSRPAAAAMQRDRHRWLLRHLFLMGSTQVFVPYDGAYRHHPVPRSLQAMAVSPARLFHGARMTYRREVIAATRFDPLLRYYCPFEDLDASYRASRRGCLLTAQTARLYHHVTTSGRMDRFRVTWLARLNHAVLIRRHAADRRWGRRAYFVLMARRMLADFLKDVLGRHFGLPQFRGSLRASVEARQVFRMSDAELETWYPAKQERIVKG